MGTAVNIVLQILTLNIWGLPDVGFRVLSPLRTERVSAICEGLRQASRSEQGWDVVLLQEVWINEDRKQLKDCGYRYYADLEDKRYAIDSGLLILSKYPLHEISRLTYPRISGTAPGFSEDGEAMARKSALAAFVLHPKQKVFIANTHLVAEYDSNKDQYFETRREQFRLFANWVKDQAKNDPFIIGGDFNFGQQSAIWKDLEREFQGYKQPNEAEKACTLCPPNTMHTENHGKVDHLIGSRHFEARDGRIAFEHPIDVEAPPDASSSPDRVTISVSDHLGWQTKFSMKAPD